MQLSIVAQTTQITDSNFEQALIDMNIDSNGLNGNILNSDATSIVSLNLFDRGIFDLKGIEAFNNLKYLYCFQNQIHNIDVRENTALEILDIEDNKVSELDLSQNAALKELYASSNLLVELNTGLNLNLEILSCNLNDLSELDITQNVTLKALWCYSNNLADLDTRMNLDLEVLFCSNNDLTDIDVSQNEALVSFSCESNGLDELSIINNSALTYLGCGSNNLTTLDITNNPLLIRVLCNNNSITTLDTSFTNDLFLLYAQNNEIETLNLSANSSLKYFRAENNSLNTIDLRSANNEIISDFNVMDNPDLTCIFVDDASASYLEDWDISDSSSFVEDEDECNSLSVEETQLITFNMFPNPASTEVNIRLEHSGETKFKLFSISGKLVMASQLSYGNNKISLPNLSAGIYVVALNSERFSTTKKLIIR